MNQTSPPFAPILPPITALAALGDHANYIYMLYDNAKVYAVDPGEAGPVLRYCEKNGLPLSGVLVTHHHWDHTDGIEELKSVYNCPVYGSSLEKARIPTLSEILPPKGELQLGSIRLKHAPIPGHTLGHIYFYWEEEKALFCGDTLFSCGCGRLFEGTPAQMMASLNILRNFPPDTLIYCGHEYTERNLVFSQHFEPNNLALKNKMEKVKKLREQGQSTLPVTLSEELSTNPFLRWDDPLLKQALGMEKASDLEVFTFIRSERNKF